MKYQGFLFVCVITLCACTISNEINNKSLSKEQTETELYQHLLALKQKYVTKNQQAERVIRYAQASDDELTDTEKLRVAKADSEGFAVGFAVGAVTGGAVGTLVTPGVGTAIGTLSGGAAIGAAYAAIWSANEANTIRDERKEIMVLDDLYRLNTDNPINDLSNSSIIFDDSICGANIGFIHNAIILSLYFQDQDVFFSLSNEEIAYYVFEDYFRPYAGYEDEYYDMYMQVCNGIENDYHLNDDNVFVYPDDIIEFYFEELQSIPSGSWTSYTEDFMRIVDQELEDDNERIFLVNGTISTFIYSSFLWNLNIPSPYSGKYLMLDVTNGDWSGLLTCNIEEQFQSMLTDPRELIYVPVISNRNIIALFVFDEISTLDVLPTNEYIILDGESMLLNVPQEISMNLGGQDIFIPTGQYEFQRFNDGYFIAIK